MIRNNFMNVNVNIDAKLQASVQVVLITIF